MKQDYRVCIDCNKNKPLTELNFIKNKNIYKNTFYYTYTLRCRKCQNVKFNQYRIEKKIKDRNNEIRLSNQSLNKISNEPRQYYDNEEEMIWVKPWKIDLQDDELEIYNSL